MRPPKARGDLSHSGTWSGGRIEALSGLHPPSALQVPSAAMGAGGDGVFLVPLPGPRQVQRPLQLDHDLQEGRGRIQTVSRCPHLHSDDDNCRNGQHRVLKKRLKYRYQITQ